MGVRRQFVWDSGASFDGTEAPVLMGVRRQF